MYITIRKVRLDLMVIFHNSSIHRYSSIFLTSFLSKKIKINLLSFCKNLINSILGSFCAVFFYLNFTQINIFKYIYTK